MNKDQIKGMGKHLKGEVQQEVGRATGDTGLRVRGKASETEGKLQRNVGDAKEALRRTDKRRSGL